MANTDSQMKVMRLNEPGGDLLDAKYFCRVVNQQNLDVVVNLNVSESLLSTTKVPQRYVILMDVSGSMNERVGGDTRTLLQRIKLFGNLFIENLPESSWVSIVTFSNVGEIVFPMTKMDSSGQKSAKLAIENLKTVGMTNTSDGMFESLKAIDDAGNGDRYRDCIILFTDGQANAGITDAKQLVQEYKRQTERMGRTNGIPVSAITIGGNEPFFLNQISTELGSDSFYWLNEASDFEADMLLPMLLRELPSIYDVKLEVTSQNGVVFSDENKSFSSQPSLKKRDGNTSRTYFIHTIPSGMKRNLYLHFKIPIGSEKEIDGQIILEVWKTFLDNNLREHRSTDYLELRLTSMMETFYQDMDLLEDERCKPNFDDDEGGSIALDVLRNVSSYTKSKNKTKTSWKDAQESMVNIMGHQCRLETASALATSADLVNRGLDQEAKETCKKALSMMEKVEAVTEIVLGKHNPLTSDLQDNVKNNFQNKLETLTEDIGNVQPGRLTAMASSFSTEMPTASGVFGADIKQPFMPKVIEDKQGDIKEILRKLKAGEPLEKRNLTPEISPPSKKILYIFKADPNLDEEYDPDSLFLSSILPDMQGLDATEKLKFKLGILELLQSVLHP